MASKAVLIGAIFSAGLAAFAWGRIRHDVIAILMLLSSVALGLVPPQSAFLGFGDPVVVTVAAVMVLSAAIARSGALRLALNPFRRILKAEIGIAAVFAALCAVTSAFMNNVGALALLLPAALTACKNARVSPSRVLMPMAFASLLGGLATLIGTPPNVIIAEMRTRYIGHGFGMFDFAPVGVPLALVGVVLTVALARFLPQRAKAGGEPLLFKVADYLFEAKVAPKSNGKPLTVGALRGALKGDDAIEVQAIDRGGLLLAAPEDTRELQAGDVVQLEGRAASIHRVIDEYELELAGGADDDLLEAAVMECVVTERSALCGAEGARDMLAHSGAALVAISRSGRATVERLGSVIIRAGDVLLLQAAEARKADIIDRFELLPLADRPIEIGIRRVDWRPLAALGAATVAASLHFSTLSIALVAAIASLVALRRIKPEAYHDIDWPVILLLACLIPVANAFSDLGAGEAIAKMLAAFGSGWPEWTLIGMVLAITMLVTPFLNNAAAVLIMGPIAADAGMQTGVPVDAMLMAVAIGASCDFLTPIGHQSNTIVMGPGSYRFFDYSRVGAPLSLLVLGYGTYLIFQVWG